MAGFVKNVKNYFGYGDEQVADYESGIADRPAQQAAATGVFGDRDEHDTQSVRIGERSAVTPIHEPAPPVESPLRVVSDAPAQHDLRRLVTIHPKDYGQAKDVGTNFRQGSPVIVTLAHMDAAAAQRMVDFIYGLAFGLEGSVERVTEQVFLLAPKNIELDSVAGRDQTQSSFFNR